MSDTIKDLLNKHLKGVPSTKIESLAHRLQGLPAERALLMADIGIGLTGISLRAAMEFLWVGSETAQLLESDGLRLWGKIGRQLAAINVDTAINFFQHSANVFRSLPPQLRGLSLALTDRQATISTQVAIDCFRAAPQLVEDIADDRLAQRIFEIGYEISRRSATQSAKFLSTAPRTLSFLRLEHRGPVRKPGARRRLTPTDRAWLSVQCLRLIDEVINLTAAFAQRVGGLAADFFSALPQTLPEVDITLQTRLVQRTQEFFEQCGGVALHYFSVAGPILTQNGPRSLDCWSKLAHQIASHGNVAAYNFLKVTPQIMSRLAATGREQADALTFDVLTLVGEISQQNIPLAIECFKSSATALQMGSCEQFARWARAGLELQKTDMRRACAYYALETNSSQQSLRDSTQGLTLERMYHTLLLYVEGLSGEELSVKRLPAFNSSYFPDHMRLGDGKDIYLPSVISEFDDSQSNFRLYKVLAAYAAGQIEFGTFAANTASLESILRRVQTDFVATPPALTEPEAMPQRINYTTVLSRFPQPEFAARLFTILEHGRIDWRLRQTYRGLRRDLDVFRTWLQAQRPSIESLPPDHVLSELLLQLALCGAPDDTPAPYADVSRHLETIIRTQLHRPQAGVADSLAAVHQIYQQVIRPADQLAETHPQTTSFDNHPAESESAPDAQAAVEEQGTLQDGEKISPSQSETAEEWAQVMARHVSGVDHNPDSAGWQTRDNPQLGPDEQAYYYDEWDRELIDYRAGWCRVVEKSGRRGGRQFVEYVRSYYGPLISSIRYQFQLLQPEALKKIRGQIDGEDFDLQAVIDYALDRRSSGRVSERLYVQRLRKQRDVAVSFLLDMSSSTARTVGRGSHAGGHAPKRIIDIEKEGLVLMCEALDAVGDLYCIQGFTSEGRHLVKFYIVKDFHEPYGPDAESRIGGISYQNNTRLGAAIRHAAARLGQQPPRTKLLIVLSDGRPYDHDYGDARYAREDTKVALRQARMQGIIPFCITIDRESENQLRDMYGEVGYTIIDNIFSLPERLPGIYRRLTG